MNSHPEHSNGEIGRLLRSLPELTAPPTLRTRVLAAIEQRQAAPWYRRSWQTWPRVPRVLCLALLLAAFGALCAGGWQLLQTEPARLAASRAGECIARLGTISSTLGALRNAAVLVLTQCTGCLVAVGAIVALAWAMFVALGAAYLQLGFAKCRIYHYE